VTDKAMSCFSYHTHSFITVIANYNARTVGLTARLIGVTSRYTSLENKTFRGSTDDPFISRPTAQRMLDSFPTCSKRKRA